jgi:hypothetical protein
MEGWHSKSDGVGILQILLKAFFEEFLFDEFVACHLRVSTFFSDEYTTFDKHILEFRSCLEEFIFHHWWDGIHIE